MNLQAVNNMLLVEIFDKANRKKSERDPFIAVVSSNNLGTVQVSSNSEYPVGTKVYYGGNHERLLVEGVELLAMKAENVIAKVID